MLHRRLRDLAMLLPPETCRGEDKIISSSNNIVTESSTELTACCRRDKSISRSSANLEISDVILPLKFRKAAK